LSQCGTWADHITKVEELFFIKLYE